MKTINFKPKLRFKEFNSEWIKKSFYDCVEINAKLIDPKDSKYAEYPHIGPANIEKHTGKLLNYKLVKDENLISGKYVFKKEDIIYGKINPQLGKVAFPNCVGLCSADSYPITSKKEVILPSFLFQHLLSARFLKYTTSVSMRTGMPKINREELSGYKFIIPSLPEQQKIAYFFTLLDRQINKQQEKVELLLEHKKGMLQKIFSQDLRFKDENGVEFPEWKERKLKDFAEKIIQKNKDFLVKNVISNSSKFGLIPQKDYFDKDIANKDNIDGYYVISKGNFVYNPRISNDAPYGPVSIYMYNDKGVVSPLYLCFKVEGIENSFLSYFFKSTLWYKHIYLNGDSGARHDRVSIKDKEFFELLIPFPCIEEQQKIANFLSKLDEKIEKEEVKLELLQEQKKGFMQQMFI